MKLRMKKIEIGVIVFETNKKLDIRDVVLVKFYDEDKKPLLQLMEITGITKNKDKIEYTAMSRKFALGGSGPMYGALVSP